MSPVRKRVMILTSSVLLLACWAGSGARGQVAAPAAAQVVTADHGPNAAEQRAKPYVVLVSMDGFRYDYPKRYGAKHLLEMAASGASAPEGMIPSYPSVTFPNHYTIVTGLYPEHHGIVANTFYDPTRKEVYDSRDARTVKDGVWYGGTPLWVLAEQQGMRSACAFWIGSEAEIQGTRPTYYLNYDGALPNGKRVAQVLEWLRLPADVRPHFITLYFADTDGAGHKFGPESPQVAAAVQELDAEIGSLMAGIQELKLPVDVIVLADHGMVKVEGPTVYLDQFGLKPMWFERVVGTNLYPRSEADARAAYEAMRSRSDKFQVYRRSQAPAHLHYDSNAREGDPIVVATGPFLLAASADAQGPGGPLVGAHGYDASRMAEMKAIFFAAGPDIRRGVTVPSFENVNVYPLVAKILGLDIAHLKTGAIDGSIEALDGILRGKKEDGARSGRRKAAAP